MVFESIIADVLNKFLGDYVENLDAKQLKVGIWGGDVVLKNLVLKPAALETLNLPIKTSYGQLGKLVLKIPWKNLYTAPVEASIEGLYLLVVPASQITFDAEKEEERLNAIKQGDLEKYEETKKKEAQKDLPKADDTFVEKLTTQIIKNVQLKVSNIHIRYEDKVTHPLHPFAAGVTLSSLSLQTTDETWKPTIVQDMVTKIYKVVDLEGLAVYWNCNSILYGSLPVHDLLHHFVQEIATKTFTPSKYNYVLGPINSSARLRLNPKPECDEPGFSLPKVHLNVDMEKLFVGISKSQYQDIIALAESLDRVARGMPYRGFRPNVPSYKDHYRQWWHFAYVCVLEDVRRKRRNFDWKHISNHREMCKNYATLYQSKLEKKLSSELQQKLDKLEKELDIVNIVIVRQQIELEIERLGKLQKRQEKKSWISSWWGGSDKNAEELDDATNFMKQFEAAMTPDEKSKLYKAIDYQENSAPLEYPEAYVDITCTFILRLLEVQVRDDKFIEPRIMSTELKGVKCRVDTRPVRSAIKVAVNIDELSMYGLQQDDLLPQIITSKTEAGEGGPLLDVLFETHPLDKTCSQRVIVNAKPLKIVYDAQTINKLVDVFRIPESMSLEQLAAAAEARLNNLKEMSASGLQHAIEKHDVLELNIDLCAPYVIIPYSGKYTGTENVLVINLGHMKISTVNRAKVDLRKLASEGAIQSQIMEQMISQSYDQFDLAFTDLQIILAQGGEDWSKFMNESTQTTSHLLNPVNLNIHFYKCLIEDDPRLPQIKVRGQLPSLTLNITDVRLLMLVGLILSIPLPEEEAPDNKPLMRPSKSMGSTQSLSLLKNLEIDKVKKTRSVGVSAGKPPPQGEVVQFTKVDLKFVMEEFSLAIFQQETVSSPLKELTTFKLRFLEATLLQQTFDTELCVSLGSIACTQMYNERPVEIVSTPHAKEEFLFVVKFIQVNRKSPEFHSKHGSCEQRLLLEFTSLNVTLHQEGLQALMKFVNDLQMQIVELSKSSRSEEVISGITSADKVRRMSSVAENFMMGVKSSRFLPRDKKQTKAVVIETIQFKLTAKLQELMVLFASEKNEISSAAIKGINCEVVVKKSYTQIVCSLHDIAVMDLDQRIYRTVLSVTSDEAVNAQIVIYNEEHKQCADPNSIDVSVQVTMGCMKIIFLNSFIYNMLDFLSRFQAAQEALVEASQAAAQSARENMQAAYYNATRVSLNIDLKAPDIIIPVSSKSYDGFLLDLGHITICNKFLALDIMNDNKQNAVLDEMKLKLMHLTLARVKLDKENNVTCNRTLLQPVTFQLLVKRNLSTAWYRAIPDIDLSGKIDAITLFLSQSDYQMLLKVLSGNMAEGKPPVEHPLPHKDEQSSISLKSSEVFHQAESKVDVTAKVHTVIKFTFQMDSFIIQLFSTKTSSGFTPEHKAKDSLGQFSLEVLSIKGRILSDQSLVTSVLLVNCLVDDTRKGREGKLTRLIERKLDTSDTESNLSLDSLCPVKSMIDVTIQTKNNDTFADVRVYSCIVILSMEYIMQLVDFFIGIAEDEVKTAHQTPSQGGLKKVASKETPKEPLNIALNLKIEKPDIILVEEMDKIDTNALILNTEVLLKVRILGTHQVINGSVNDIQLYTCCFDPKKRTETKNPVLHPVSISIAGSTPEGQGLHVEICVTDIRFSVTPSVIELLNRIYQTMFRVTATAADSDTGLATYSDIWDYKPYTDQEFWFLRADVAEEAVEYVEIAETPSFEDQSISIESTNKVKEMCIISLNSLVVTLEAGIGSKTLPMLMLESSFRGSVLDWSSQLSIEAGLTMQVAYYNSRLALWEPLIEPVENMQNNRMVYVPWSLKLEVSMNEFEDNPALSPISEEEDHVALQALMTIDITSSYNLEITVTKTALEVMNNLGKAFSNAIASGIEKSADVWSAPFKVKNETGLKITLRLNQGSFKISGPNDPLEAVLESGAQVPLEVKPCLEAKDSLHIAKNLVHPLHKTERYLNISITDSFTCDLELPVVRADKRYFFLNHKADGNDTWGLVSDVTVEDGILVITLRSILRVKNHFNTAVDVYYMTSRGNELQCIATVEPGGSFNVPLKSVYTPTNELFFSVAGYSVTNVPFIWKDLQLNLSVTKIMHCQPKKAHDNASFVIKAVGETAQIYHENTNRHTMSSTCYTIHLYPALTLKNCLPIDIIYCLQGTTDEKLVKPGESLPTPTIEPGKSTIIIKLPQYLEKEWSCQHEIATNPPEFAVWQFDSYDSVTKVSLDLGLHSLLRNGTIQMSLYCPFWMLNKTGLLLSYRKSKKTERNEASGSPAKSSDENLNILHHPANFKGPVLFSFNAKNFFGKKKASIRVEQGEWSDKFSLDVAGSAGFVVCKANSTIYQIGVHNQLTYNGLSKQVTFTPYYVIINNALFLIECQELDRPADPWIRVQENSCTALWPRSEKDDKLLKLRVGGTEEISASFLYTETHTTLLKLKNKYGGINVDIQMSEGGIYINLTSYEDGMAPALIINHTRDTLNIWEKNTVQIRKLTPGHKFLYTWEQPSGPRVLVWDIGRKKELEDDLRKDGVGDFSPEEDYRVYWVSFLNGMQRVLLFTMDQVVADSVQTAKQFELVSQEINVSIHGLGLSLVNNILRQEIMYIGIASSGIIWETCKLHSKRFKQMNARDSANMERAYQIYLTKQRVPTPDFGRALIDNKTEVDFETADMLKPHKKKIRRTFQTGLWLQMRTSPSQLQLHAKVNRLQIDNQMFDCIFPVVLAPVPPPKSVAGDAVPKPFAELSIVQRLMKYSQIRQFKYFKVLIQEFHIKVDLGFINALVELLETSEYSEHEERELFLKDVKLVDEPLLAHVSTQSLQEQKNFYDLLHFSPLKVHVSFSMASGSSGSIQEAPNFLNVLLQGLGVTLTDMQDVIFKLAYFQRDYTFLTQKLLINEATRHYVGQFVKQLYVLVLGLDVLGNPYGLVVGITQGVEDFFYEPFQGAIQGPGEFVEGLAYGVRSLFGHTVGGAAGAVSRITGAVGKGIAVLTFDKEYQRKRRDQINKKPATVQEGIARGGKGLVMGVVDGVTGVFTKPISGAKEQGVEGFFKGLGKGAVGLVARPTAGVIDFASGSLDAVKRATELGEETLRLRPPRFISADGLVKPYNHREADGLKLLMELEKGKYATTDIYSAHYIIVEKKEILLLTDKRVAYITHNDIFGGWQVDWAYTWPDLQIPPKVISKGVAITSTDVKKRRLSLFGSSDSGKIILVADPAVREEICSKIEELMKNA